MRVIDFFDRAAGQQPKRECLVEGDHSWSYDVVRQRSIALARWLRDETGIPKPKIGILAPNCALAFVAILAIFRAGGIWVPVNGRAAAEEIGDFLNLVDCDLLLIHEAFADLGFQAAAHGGCAHKMLPDNLAPARDQAEWRAPYSSDDICSVFSTGGTTGSPKAAMWSHRTWSALISNFLSGIHHDGPPVHLVAAPLTHAAGVIAIPLMAIGATTVIIDRAEPKLVMESIERHSVTTLFLPPTVIYTMLAHPDIGKHDYSSLQNLIYAAAPMAVGKLKEAIQVFGPVMVQTYGQAEAPMVCTIFGKQAHIDAIRTGDDERLASCGRPGLLTEVAILDEEGRLLHPGMVGEIAVRGDLLMTGYYGDDAATDACRTNGWQRTGDIGLIGRDGYISITDRKRDMIITGGFNVYPSSIEQVLWAHPAVQDCAVIGVPDPKWGEAVVAIIELKRGAACDPETLIALCKTKLNSIQAPKRIEFWPELPRSPVGKVLKRAIRDTFWAGHIRAI